MSISLSEKHIGPVLACSTFLGCYENRKGVSYGLMATVPRCDEELWREFEVFLHEQGCQRFLESISEDFSKRIIDVQLRQTGGDAELSLSNALSAMKRIERATKALHKHERLMNKQYFEEILKADLSMCSGKDVEHGRQIFWLRGGIKCRGIWKIKYGSPKAHAHIRQCIYQFQVVLARLLAEKDFSSSMGATIVVLCDMVGLGRVLLLLISQKMTAPFCACTHVDL